MEDLKKRITSIAEGIIESEPGLFLVEVLIKGNVGNQKVLILIDGDDGINIDHCGSVSRELGSVLEEEDIMSGKYLLEVSSPGLDHPIKLKRQYKKNEGRSLEVETKDGEKVKGKLTRAEEEAIILQTKDGEKIMNFEEINQSKIEVSFR